MGLTNSTNIEGVLKASDRVNVICGDVVAAIGGHQSSENERSIFVHGINSFVSNGGGVARALEVLTDCGIAESFKTSGLRNLRIGDYFKTEFNGVDIYNLVTQVNPGCDARYGNIHYAVERLMENLVKSKQYELNHVNFVLIGAGVGGLDPNRCLSIFKFISTAFTFNFNIWVDPETFSQLRG